MAGPKIGVVIVNWNNPADTIRCLEALTASTYPADQVVVVDNGSQDNSLELLKDYASQAGALSLEIIANPVNLGYTGGNNLGMHRLLQQPVDYLLLLNDDAVLDAACLAELARAAETDPQAGFLGPKILAIETDSVGKEGSAKSGTLLSTGGIFEVGWQAHNRGMGEIDQGQYDQSQVVDFLSGCALLVNRKAIEQVGMLDDDFFAYHEEVDWCFRAQRVGIQARYVPKARVWHPDTRTRDSDSPTVTYYTSRNSLLFIRKHHLGWKIMLRRLTHYVRQYLSWSLRPKWRHKRPQQQALAKALLDFLQGRTGQGLNC